MRLGELLVREGILSLEDRDRALAHAAAEGTRLGTALVQLGLVEVDTVARALSGLQRVPVVLEKHVAAIDPAAIALVPAKLAHEHHALPLGFTPTKPPRLVIAFRDPHTAPVEELAFAAGMRIEAGIAPELVVARSLLHYYGPAPTDPQATIASGACDGFTNLENDVALAARVPDIAPAPRAPTSASPPTHPALSLPPPPELDPPELDPTPLDAPELDEPPPRPLTAPPGALTPVLDVDGALQALQTARTRDEIGATLSAWLQSAYGFGLVLVVKDVLGMAIGWRGYSPIVDDATLETIAMPLGPASMLTTAYEGRVSFRGPPLLQGAGIHRKLWTTLQCRDPEPEEVLVIPVLVGERVVNILYTHVLPGQSLADSALEDAARVAAGAATAYARIIRKK